MSLFPFDARLKTCKQECADRSECDCPILYGELDLREKAIMKLAEQLIRYKSQIANRFGGSEIFTVEQIIQQVVKEITE